MSPYLRCIRLKNFGVLMRKVRVRKSLNRGFGPGGRSSDFAFLRVMAGGMGWYSPGRGFSKGLSRSSGWVMV